MLKIKEIQGGNKEQLDSLGDKIEILEYKSRSHNLKRRGLKEVAKRKNLETILEEICTSILGSDCNESVVAESLLRSLPTYIHYLTTPPYCRTFLKNCLVKYFTPWFYKEYF